jgi:predicted lipase
MPEDVNKQTEEVIETGDTQATEPNQTMEEIKFEDLSPEIQKFIDRERGKASMTAREKARRDALKDPDIRKTLQEELEAEATLTAEQKVERRLKEALTIESRALAREKLVDNGITGEELSEILELVVTDDKDATLARVDKFAGVVKKALEKEQERNTRKALQNTPKPKTQTTETKDFKDMGFEERMKLKEADPAKYKAEMEKLRTKI